MSFKKEKKTGYYTLDIEFINPIMLYKMAEFIYFILDTLQ